MEGDRVFERDENLVTRTIAGETIIVPVADRVCDLDSIYTLNEVGSRVWALLDGRASAGQIAGAIESEYAVDPDRARADVAGFLGDLEASRLIRPIEAG